MSSISPPLPFVPLEPYESLYTPSLHAIRSSFFIQLKIVHSLRVLLAAVARRTEWQILRTKSVLLHGPPQVGKITLITALAEELGIEVINIRPWKVVLDYQRGALWPEKAFDSYFNEACKRPSILLLKGIEVMFPLTEMEGGASNDTYYINALMSQFLTHLDKLANDDTDAVVIGITNKIDALNPIVRSRFEDEMEMDGPTPTQRTLLLTKQINNCKMDSLTTESDVSKIGKHTHGYMPGDMAALSRDATLLAFSRTLPGESVSLRTDDFVKTCRSHPPHNLSGLALQGTPKTVFDDIGGLQEVKEALKEVVVWANIHSEKLRAARIRPPRGVLLYGPPGTGKTMLARAVANEAAANFISVNISDLSQGEVGESEKALKGLFRRANQSRPSVIFLDEVQALFTSRSSGKSSTLHSQLVLELDNSEGVIVLAATNCPSAIDAALLRPGRLDMALFIPPPTLEGRITILSKALSTMHANADVNIVSIAEESDGLTGADLHNLCNTAGLLAMRELMENINNSGEVEIKQGHLEKVLRNTLPSVTQEMVEDLRVWQASRK